MDDWKISSCENKNNANMLEEKKKELMQEES